jgi:hypothetical protein
VTALRNLAVAPSGLASYGSGSSGCAGAIALSASGAPTVGSAGFAFVCTAAPRSSNGFGFVGNVQDVAGTDSLGLGAKLHVNLFASSALNALGFLSDAEGIAFAPAPIPSSAALAGAKLYAQVVWKEKASDGLACSASPFDLVTSKGLAVTILP